MSCCQPALPLHPSQENVYLDQIMHPDEPLYNVASYQRLDFKVDVNTLQTCWRLLHQRIDVLQMRLVEQGDGTILQCFDNETVPELEVLDFQNSDSPEDAARIWMGNKKVELMDFINGEVSGAAILKIAPQQYFLFVRFHHIALDAQGGFAFMEYFHRLYQDIIQNENINWINEIPQFRDQIEKSEKYAASKRYIKDRDFNLATFSNKSLERLPKYYTEDRNGRLSIPLSLNLSSSLKHYCHEHGLTPLSLLITSVSAVMRLMLNTEYVGLGVLVHGRSTRKDKETVGMLVETVYLTCETSEHTDYLSLAKKSSQLLSEGFRHYKFPTGHLARLLNNGSAPLVDTIVDYEMYGYEQSKMHSPSDTILLVNQLAAQPLNVRLLDFKEKDQLLLEIVYSKNYFKTEEAERLFERVVKLIEQMIAAPYKSLSDFPEFLAGEKQALINQNLTTEQLNPPTLSSENTLHQRFEAQAMLTPENIALTLSGESMTYAELNRKADQFAAHIQKAYWLETQSVIKPDTLIGLYFDTSIEMIVSILGVLKSGAAYVPISPKNPEQRTTYILEDINTALILTQAKHFDVLNRCIGSGIAISHQPRLIDVHDFYEVCEHKLTCNVKHDRNALAYVIYTSGTTGRPKGVMIEHHSIVSSINYRCEYYSTCESFLLLSHYAFDSSVAGIFGALSSGAKLVLTPSTEPEHILRALKEESVTHTLLTPSHYLALLEDIKHISSDLALDSVIVAGESLNASGYQLHQSYLPHINLFNEYGPTENSVWTTVHLCNEHDRTTPNNIGGPIINSRAYVVDASGKLVQKGLQGELLISGPGLARGYLNQAQLTAERFLSNPFATPKDKELGFDRVYKTGDWVRWLPNNELMFLERKDKQVKIRGFRVELGEVELALSAIDNIKQSVVTVETKSNINELVAYAVLYEKNILKEREIKSALKAKLPEYMVPSKVIELDEIPLTINGKVDLKALPKKAHVTPAKKQSSFSAETQRLADIWTELLSVEQVNLDDDFFDIGGNSLLLVRLRSKIKSVLNVEVNGMELLKSKSLSSMAALVKNKMLQETSQDFNNITLLHSLNRAKGKLTLLCLPYAAADGNIFTNLSDQLSEDVNILSLVYPTAQDDTEPFNYAMYFKKIIDELKAHNAGPVVILGHCLGGVVAMYLTQQLMANGFNIKALVIGGLTLTPESLQPIKAVKKTRDNLAVQELLISAGLMETKEDLTEEEWQEINHKFHEDSLLAHWAREGLISSLMHGKLSVPFYNIIAKDDPLTAGYVQNMKVWERLVSNPHLVELEQGGHYFINKPCPTLVKNISDILESAMDKTPVLDNV